MKSRLLTKFLSAAMAITLIGQAVTALATDSVSYAAETTISASARAGSSLSTASGISLGNTYKGNITKTNTKDYYKFTVSSSGRINLSMTSNITCIRYYLYDSSGNQLWTDYSYWNSSHRNK